MVCNVHERVIPGSPEEVWTVLIGIEKLWPADIGSFRLPDGVHPGAPVHHGPWRYVVGAVEPGRRLWFDTGKVLSEGHGFVLIPVEGGTLVRHELKGRLSGTFRLLWPLVVRRLHDKVVEHILEALEREVTRNHAR
ncbi:hypothetical protein GCM10022224_040020 [Nonomuraea antimicrobica]|uniref:Polyketide cyclase / dehydrase and lipid transport n=1 Tax=Nonomuraea antimicrobica TaxID=561173 RepID=A0ABP7BWH7_9ACTN